MARQLGGAVGALVVDHHHGKIAGIVLLAAASPPYRQRHRPRRGAGTTAMTCGHALGVGAAKPHSLAIQKSPRAAIRYTQIASAMKATRSTTFVRPAVRVGPPAVLP